MAQIDVNLRDVFRVVRRRKWIILFAPILMGLSTFFFTEVPPPVYNAEALIKVTRSSTVAGLMTDLVSYGAYDNMATQIMVITSRPVLEVVATRLNMVRDGVDAEGAFNDLRGRVSAEQRNESDILAIRASGSSSEETVSLANTVVDAYVERYSSDRDKRLNETLQFIQTRLEESVAELDSAQKNFSDFKREEANSLALGPNMVVELQERQLQARQKLEDLKATLTTLSRIQQTMDYDSLMQAYFVVDDGAVRSLTDDAVRRATTWVDLRNKRNDLLRYQTDVSPPVVAITTQLTSEQQRLNALLNNLVQRLNSLIGDGDKILNTALRQQEDLRRQPEVLAELDTLQSLLREKQDLTSGLRKQLQDAEIAQKEKVEEISVVERAHGADMVPQPGRYYKAIIGALIGILIGCVFAFVLESMDTSLGTIEDVEQHISSVVLGVIPHLEKDDVKERMHLDRNSNLPPEDVDRFARLAVHFDPKSVGSEAYRTLRTNILSLMSRSGGKVILVSSSMIQEGKTTSCVNLATAFAQTGKRTLLVDADLRRPNVEKLFGLERSPGLTDLLLNTGDPRECYRTIDDMILGKFGLKLAQTTPGLEFLTILPAGRIVDKPTELLNSPAMDQLLLDVRSQFDVILIDVSPIMPVADAFILAPKMDGVILAYQIGRVARDVLRRTKLRVENLGGKVWGIILNDIRSEIDYRKGDFNYYQYRYDTAAPVNQTLFDRIRGLVQKQPRSRKKKPATPRPVPARSYGSNGSVVPKAPAADPEGSHEVDDIMALTDDEGK